MALRHGKDTQLLIAQYDASPYFRSLRINGRIEMADSTVFQAEDHTYIPGLGMADFEAEHVFDTVFVETLDDWRGSTGEVFSWYPAGDTLSSEGEFGKAMQSELALASPVGDIVLGAYRATVSAGLDSGVSLHSKAAAETGADDETSHDSGASTANGGAAYLHMTAFTGTDITVTVEHSANDSSWATLATFAQLAAVGSQRVVVAEGTTVNQYLRAEWSTSGGFSSATFNVGFARR